MNLIWLLAQGRTLPDTVVMRLVPPDPSWFERVTGIASGVTSLVPYILLIALIWVAIRLRHSFEQARGSLENATKDLRELVDAANRMAQDVAAVTEMVRRDVAAVHDTVEFTNRRARRAVTALADRIDDFTATIEAVQHETQGVIVSGLAALRGVRAGVAAMRGQPRRRPRPPAVLEDDHDDPPPRPRLRRRASAE